MATRAEKIAEFEADRTRLRAAIAEAQTASASAGVQVGDMSVQSGVGINVKYLREELNIVEKSLQRLKNGGRGIVVDMSARSDGSDP